jgi:hypothetical protein
LLGLGPAPSKLPPPTHAHPAPCAVRGVKLTTLFVCAWSHARSILTRPSSQT